MPTDTASWRGEERGGDDGVEENGKEERGKGADDRGGDGGEKRRKAGEGRRGRKTGMDRGEDRVTNQNQKALEVSCHFSLECFL